MHYMNTSPSLIKFVNATTYESYFAELCQFYGAKNISKEDVAWVAVPAEEFDKLFSEDAYFDKWYQAVIVPKEFTGSVNFRRVDSKSLHRSAAVWNITSNTLKFLSLK